MLGGDPSGLGACPEAASGACPVVSGREVRDDSRVKRLATVVLAAAGVALGLVAYRVQMDNLHSQTSATSRSARMRPTPTTLPFASKNPSAEL